MATGYIRQSAANIAAGLPIQSADINAEYNQLQSAFDNAAGHDHSGSATGVGAKITLTTAVTGTLPIANGGTNNSTAYTSGSVIFSNGTSLTQNNAKLFWDNTNNRLGIGDTTPSYEIDVTGSINFTSNLYLASSLLIDKFSGSTRFYDPEAHAGLLLGDTTGGGASLSQSRQATFKFQNRAGTQDFATIDNTGIHTLIAPLAIADGGTGGITQVAAFTNIVVAAQSVAANGYIKFPTGLIMQWGAAIFIAVNTVTVTFPIAFPTNIWNVQVSRKSAAGAANDVNFDNISTTTFDVTTDANYTGTAYWWAIGN